MLDGSILAAHAARKISRLAARLPLGLNILGTEYLPCLRYQVSTAY